jgi:hypothetical protein
MLTKTQSVSGRTQRVARNPVELRNDENTTTNQTDQHSQDFHARVSERAYALYEEHGREDGHALENWLEAEQQVRNED